MLLFNSLVDELLDIAPSKSSGLSLRVLQPWCAPASGCFKLNIDAAFKNGVAGLACIVRDCMASRVLVRSKKCDCRSAFDAELLGLEWASEPLVKDGWSNPSWCSDSKEVVSFINSASEHGSWLSRYTVVRLRNLFQQQKWTLTRSARESNNAADLVAKLACYQNPFIDFLSPPSVVPLPQALVDCLLMDQ